MDYFLKIRNDHPRINFFVENAQSCVSKSGHCQHGKGVIFQKVGLLEYVMVQVMEHLLHFRLSRMRWATVAFGTIITSAIDGLIDKCSLAVRDSG